MGNNTKESISFNILTSALAHGAFPQILSWKNDNSLDYTKPASEQLIQWISGYKPDNESILLRDIVKFIMFNLPQYNVAQNNKLVTAMLNRQEYDIAKEIVNFNNTTEQVKPKLPPLCTPSPKTITLNDIKGAKTPNDKFIQACIINAPNDVIDQIIKMDAEYGSIDAFARKGAALLSTVKNDNHVLFEKALYIPSNVFDKDIMVHVLKYAIALNRCKIIEIIINDYRMAYQYQASGVLTTCSRHGTASSMKKLLDNYGKFIIDNNESIYDYIIERKDWGNAQNILFSSF